MKKHELFVIQGTDYTGMTKAVLDRAELCTMIPDKTARIGIKPNLVGQILAEEGGTTHPEIVAGVIEYLQEHGYYDLLIMEGSWVGDLTENTVKYCGYDRICERYGVPFMDMQKDAYIEKDCAGMKLNICRLVSEVDFLINIPVLKGHCQTRMTCALKNMKGLLPNTEKRRFHRMGLMDPIAHLAVGIHQDFILVDSICGDLTFEDGGNPVIQNRLIAASDPVLCDAFCSRILGFAQEDIPYIGKAEALGAGNAHPEEAAAYMYHECRDNGKKLYICDQKQTENGAQLAERLHHEIAQRTGFGAVMRLSEKAEEVDSCSACYGYLLPALHMLEQEGMLDRLHEKICIGQGYRGKTGELGVGSCTAKFRRTLSGCPPTELQMYEFLKAYIIGQQSTE